MITLALTPPDKAVRLLQKRGFNQATIATLANTTQATICRILSGQKGVDYKIVDALRIAVAKFCEEPDKRQAP